MTGIVHAIIGAGIGALCKNRLSAFTTGILSHIAADILPHRDLDPKVEVPLLAGSLAVIAKRYGLDSKQFAGALGAILPDSEHGLMVLGLINEEDEIFPTHLQHGQYHGPDSGEHLSQVIVAAVAIMAAEKHR